MFFPTFNLEYMSQNLGYYFTFINIITWNFWTRLLQKYDRKAIHDAIRNTYTLEKNGWWHTLLPSQDEWEKEEVGPNMLLMSGKELL